jgi:hypothetical protein
MPARVRRQRPRPRQDTLRPYMPQAQKGGLPYTELAPPAQPLPVDPIYTGQTGAINLNYENVLAGGQFDRTQIGQQYGYDEQGNLDPSNPYSVAANLQRRFQQGQSGTTNSYAERGLGYSGAHQSMLDEGTYQYGRAQDEARRAAAGLYQGVTEREQQARFDRDIGLSDAGADRLGRLDPEDTVPGPTSIPRTGPVSVPRNVPSLRRRRRRR